MSAPSGPKTPPSAPPPVTAATPSSTTTGHRETDWTDQVTDLIVDSVDKVRARTTGPILEGAKGLVYAIVALTILSPIVVLGAVGLIRLVNWAVPGDVWIVYAMLGTTFLLAGVVVWSKRGRPAA